MTHRPAILVCLSVCVPRRQAGRVEKALAAAGTPAAQWRAAGDPSVRFDLYLTSPREAGRVRLALAGHLRAAGVPDGWIIRRRTLAPEDWANSWKRFFHAQQVSPRVVVAPSWEAARAPRGGCVVSVDPGMSFGTGQHATTRGCLELLDEAAGGARRSFLDVGCGSGILAIAAARLGFRRVAAIDCDPDAVGIARENARRNRVGARIRFAAADLAAFRPGRGYDVVAANLTARPLREGAAALAAAVSKNPAARLILSGMRDRQWSQVRPAFARRGLREAGRRRREGWTTVCLVRAGRADRVS